MHLILTMAEFEQYMIYIWLGIFIIMLIIEGATSEVVSIWFAISAIVALILSAIPGIPLWVEVIVFAVVSVILLIAFRPLAKKYLSKNKIATNADSLIGRQAKVTKEISPLEYGLLKLQGATWTALSEDESQVILIGTLVEVVSIEGNKLVVKVVTEKNSQ